MTYQPQPIETIDNLIIFPGLEKWFIDKYLKFVGSFYKGNIDSYVLLSIFKSSANEHKCITNCNNMCERLNTFNRICKNLYEISASKDCDIAYFIFYKLRGRQLIGNDNAINYSDITTIIRNEWSKIAIYQREYLKEYYYYGPNNDNEQSDELTNPTNKALINQWINHKNEIKIQNNDHHKLINNYEMKNQYVGGKLPNYKKYKTKNNVTKNLTRHFQKYPDHTKWLIDIIFPAMKYHGFTHYNRVGNATIDDFVDILTCNMMNVDSIMKLYGSYCVTNILYTNLTSEFRKYPYYAQWFLNNVLPTIELHFKDATFDNIIKTLTNNEMSPEDIMNLR